MSFKVKAKATKKVFQNGDFYIYGMSPLPPYPEDLKINKYFSFTLKGDLSYITEGKEYELEIEELATDSYGTSYKVLSVPSIDCSDLENLNRQESFEILSEITTERLAKNILDAYPNFIWKVLTEGKESIDVSKIYGVGDAYLSAFVRELNTKYKYLNIMNKFKNFKLDIGECKALIDEYKDEDGIKKALEDNPYKCLVEIVHKSFENADKVIMELRPDLRVSEQRCAYLILSVLQKSEAEGSTRLNGNDLYFYIMEQYNVPELKDLIVPTAKTNDLFYYDEASCDLAIMETYLGECRIAQYAKERIANSTKLDIDWSKYTTVDGFQMSDQQTSALKLFCESNFMILAGFSGSGKTSSLKALIALMEDNGLSYTLLAPTGKASRRITESTNRPSSTIHRQCLRTDGKITTDVVVVDETSMVDLPTFLMMINAIDNPNIRVVLVGDNAQLIPVGIGCVFNDLINSGKIPMVMLDKIFRYDTNGGLFVATNVRQGKQFFDNKEMVKQNGNVYSICDNYKFIQTENIFDTLISEYMKLINKGVKPSDILCLSPYNVGDEGSYKINNAIQTEINPPKPNQNALIRKISGQRCEIGFRLGDRVLNKKNDYNALTLENWEQINDSNGLLTSEDVGTTSVFNGQDGIVRQVDKDKLVAQFDEELIVFDKSKLNNLLLGYCISVHSSQGSEAKYVLNVVSPSHKRMLNRNLLYVADTRAKVMQIDIGDMATYNDALLIDGNEERDTFLKDLLNAE